MQNQAIITRKGSGIWRHRYGVTQRNAAVTLREPRYCCGPWEPVCINYEGDLFYESFMAGRKILTGPVGGAP